MPEIHITEAQQERFDALREELAAEHAGSYATVRTGDVVEYLLDLAEEVDDSERILGTADGPKDSPSADTANGVTEQQTENDDGADVSTSKPDGEGTGVSTPKPDDGGGGGLDGMLNLLETHDDKWREASGEERYEVELEDGSVETARTKDDVKAILFKHY